MNTQEMIQKYTALYDKMSGSQKTENMMLFGRVMTEMMHTAIQKMPSEAAMWIDELQAIEWDNYLTPKEAERIVAQMQPAAPWGRDEWNKAMETYGLEKEDRPYYNSCALWVMMNAMYSDHSKTIAKILGMPLNDIDTETMLSAIYMLAVDKLKDIDAKVNIQHLYSM